MLAQGGQGDDTFTVYSNQAAVRLEGDDGNDLFTVRAFALAATVNTGTPNEEIDWIDPQQMIARPKLTAGFSTAAETAIRTGAGNNQVEYNINAPVSVDGGNGFDKLVVLGTEFADHIVVTSKGIFGAGLTVTYQNIEVLEIDALEGDDTIDVLSTQAGVVTRVIGGLGNDQINVAGDVAGPVVSRGVEGTSGVINDNINSQDPSYNGLVADGIVTSVARSTQGQIVIEETNGFTEVREDGTVVDSYNVSLAFQPTAGKKVYVTVSGAMSPQEEHGNSGLLGSGDISDNLGTGDSLLVSENPPNYQRSISLNGVVTSVPKRSTVLVFDSTNWNLRQTVNVAAVNDTLAEGDRTVTISHSVLSDDPRFNHAIVRNVEVLVRDKDQPGIVVTQLDPGTAAANKYGFALDNATTVLEGTLAPDPNPTGVADLYAVELAKAPVGVGAVVRVAINMGDSRAVLTSLDSRFVTVTAPTANAAGVYYVEFNSANWNTAVLVTVSARNDNAPEDPHNTSIAASIDLAHTHDVADPVSHTSYSATPVTARRIDARVIDDENAGVFQVESGGTTLVQAGTANGGPGSGDSYTLRLTSPPKQDVDVALVTDGQTDIAVAPGIVYKAIGGLQTVQLFTGNVSVAGATITRAAGSELGSWTDDGFALGMLVRIASDGIATGIEGKIVAISGDGKTFTLDAATATGLVDGLRNISVVSQLVERGAYTGQLAYTAASQPFVLFAGNVTVSGTTVTRGSDGSFIDDGFAIGQTISFGDGSTGKFVVAGFSVDGHTLTLASAATNGTYASASKLLGTLRRIDGTSWLDSGFLEGQLFQLSDSAFAGQTFKIDLITDAVAGSKKLDLLVISDPAHVGSVVPNAAKLLSSGTTTVSNKATQWAAVAHFVASTDPNNPTAGLADWYKAKTVNVVADPGFDTQPGHQNLRSFPKIEHRLDGIRGPLSVEGGTTSAVRAISRAIMLPGEANGPLFAVPPQPPESMSIDTLNIYDDGSRENLKGTLTSTALTGLNMGSGLDFTSLFTPGQPAPFGEPGVYPGGISFGSISLVDDPAHPGKKIFSTDSGRSTIEVLNIMLGQGNDQLAILGSLVPGPDHDPLTGAQTTVSTHGGVTAVHGGGNALLQVNANFTLTTVSGNAVLTRVDGLKWSDYGFTVGQRVLLSTPNGAAAFTVTGFANQTGGIGSRLLLGGGSAAIVDQTAVGGFKGSVTVVDDLSVSGSFTVQSDRIIRNDNLPWQNLGFAIGQQVAFTTGGVTTLYTVTDFDNGPGAGLGSALLLSGNPLTAGTVTGTVGVASRFNVTSLFTATATTLLRGTGSWLANGFAVGQQVAVSGQPGTLTVKSVSADGKTLTIAGGVIASTGSVTLTVGVVRVGGDNITVSGAAAAYNGTYNVAPGQITRTDSLSWTTDLHFAIGQQLSVNGVNAVGQTVGVPWLAANGETSAQLVVTGFSADGKTLFVNGTTLSTGSFKATVVINSPLVVYGDTSQDGVWYNGKTSTLSLGKFSNKPMPHEDALRLTFGSITQFGKTFGTITRTTGSWTDSGFVPEGLITVDGVLVGTVSQVINSGKTLVLFRADLTTSTDLSGLWTGLTNAAHNIVQRNRLGQSSDFFIFPLANPFQYSGNDVIDASALYAAIPDGQLPTVGLTAYGGAGNDTIIGSQAGDHLAGGSGDDTILGQRGVDLIYGDAGFNVDLITRELTVTHVAKLAGVTAAVNLDPLTAGRDTLYGDAPGSTKSDIYGDYDDVIIGDHGLVTQDVAGARDTTKAAPTLPQALQTTMRARKIETAAPQNGADDQIYGNGGQDILLGGTGNDAIDGGAGMDLVFGDHASLDRTTHLNNFTDPRFQALQGTQIYSTATATAGQDLADNVSQLDPRGDPEGRVRRVFAPVWGDYVITEVGHTANSVAAYQGNDYIAGGAGDDTLFGELGNDVIQGDGSIDFVATKHTYAPTLSGTDVVVVNTTTSRGRVGASRDADGGGTTGMLTWYASYDSPATDGHDYVEGGGGSDVVFGNQGQDDIVGGSSDFFGKTDGVTATVLLKSDPNGRPDSGDILFGGSGTQVARNDLGAATATGTASDGTTQIAVTTATGHADDSDMILGDNGDIIRLVGTSHNVSATPGFLSFNYDNYGSTKIVVRAARLLDYTPGGPNFSSVALSDKGGNDEIHGEAGDDFLYGMTGNDRIYGDGQDDDIIGGWGNDWISGGAGDDGVIGDDGRIFTSRNSMSADPTNAGYLVSQGESLYGIASLLPNDLDTKHSDGNALNEFIYTPGNVQTATINLSGALNKTVDITPFSTDVNWNGSADEYGIAGTKANGTGGVGVQPAHWNDDIIFGGLGSDWLHGGSGDDAISGAEALPVAAAGSTVSGTTAGGVTLVDNLVISGWLRPFNPGNVLAFDPVDANGQHADHRTRAGEFALYDEYNPLSKIMVASTATPGTVYNFLLNFNTTEGSLHPAGTSPGNVNQSVAYGTTNDDGGDRIFGDLGNDWLVGGTGRDDMYGGLGNDLMNADDNHDSTIGAATALGKLANNVPDTAPSYEDRAFGGGGRDVLIANTGGDRLMDWTGEFNSYLVPFAPFGMATVSRTVQPQLPEFLYAISGSDGIDLTRAADSAALPGASPTADLVARHGEPFGELGLVLQKDAAWHDTHGGPSDPQAGNIPGGKRDVLRTASFDDGTASGFVPVSGSWVVANGRYQVTATGSNPDALSLFNEADTVIPAYFEMQATINAVKPTGGTKANAFLIFDYQSAVDFKFAGIDVSTNKMEIGHRTTSGWVIDNWNNATSKAGNDYIVMLTVNSLTATLTLGTQTVSFTYPAARIDAQGVRHTLNDGLVGVGANGAAAQIDTVIVQAPPGAITVDRTAKFDPTAPASLLFGTTPQSGTWTTTADGHLVANTTTTTPAFNFVNLGGVPAGAVTAGSLVELTSVLRTSGAGGVVFDYQGALSYKYVTLSADTRQLVIGHVTPSGNVVDGSYAVNVSASTDYTLVVSLRGALVNVSLNGAVVLSKLYPAESVTSGQFGLISVKGTTSGQTSFDSLRVRTDDLAYVVPAPLHAAVVAPAGASSAQSLAVLSATDLSSLVTEAKRRWAVLGLSSTQLAALDTVTVEVADLPGTLLGDESGTHIVIDSDAAGYGWFVDHTPRSDSEFHRDASGILVAHHGAAAGHMDLLSALMHEFGHAAGLDHSGGGVMADVLLAGTRSTPAADAGQGIAAAPSLGSGGVHPSGFVIDWSAPVSSVKTEAGAAVGGRNDDWMNRFVNHLGIDATQMNPNAKIQLIVPVQPRVEAL